MIDARTESYLDDFLDYIEEGRVIPIIGEELLVVQTDSGEVSLYSYLASCLAEKLSVLPEKLAPDFTINDVICQHISEGGQRQTAYTKMNQLMNRIQFQPPEVLRNLARIKDLNLFVVLTFDSFLVRAIDEIRYGGKKTTEQLAYSRNNPDDLPLDKHKLLTPLVYNLMGKHCSIQDFVLTDEDTLEFVHRMHSNQRGAELLFDALRSNHLLFLGCTLSDWLARFVIRIVKARTLSEQRNEMELFISSRVHQDEKLVRFLRHFSPRTELLALSPTEFVARLETRYRERINTDTSPPGKLSVETANVPALSNTIFLSYAREDYNEAKLLYNSLIGSGINIWFDDRRLDPGVQFRAEIETVIQHCLCFMPLISTKALTRQEGFFWREWNIAIDRALGMPHERGFIIPVAIDHVSPSNYRIPPRIREANWTVLPGGVVTQEFRDKMQQLVDKAQRPEHV